MLMPTLVTPPASEPLTVAQAKSHLRVDHTDDDTLITGYIEASRQYVEERCWCSVQAQTWKLLLNDWPHEPLTLPRGPVVSISSVRYQTAINTWVTLASDQYALLQDGRWWLAYDMQWPTTALYGWEPVEITYTAGVGASTALRQAMLLLIGHWYENREAVVVTPGVTAVKVPLAVDSLLYLYELR